jgi:hypothetical protein
MTSRRHPHEGRVAETYRLESGRFVFVGYATDPPPHAAWSEDLAVLAPFPISDPF